MVTADGDSPVSRESTAQSSCATFEDFYAQHRDAIAGALSLALGDVGLGTDATDEAMTRAYDRWAKIGRYDSPAGWVYRVGLNWARSRLRRTRRENRDAFGEPATQPPLPHPELDAALADLSVEHRSVVVCRYLLDWSVEQTAVALDIAPGTVKSRLSRALERLQITLEDDR